MGLVTYFAGLDLGQRRNPAAVVVVERAEVFLGLDRVTYERRRGLRYRIFFLERMRLGTPYPDVVERVRELVRRPEMAGRCTLSMDATGVGMPVLDMLRKASLGCSIAPVIITGGERESHSGGLWYVPKRDLITGLQVMLEKRELGLPVNLAATRLLTKELQDFQERAGRRGGARFGAWHEGQHDDLVIAAALATWRARWKTGAGAGWRGGSLGLW